MCKCASLAHTYAFNTHNYILHISCARMTLISVVHIQVTVSVSRMCVATAFLIQVCCLSCQKELNVVLVPLAKKKSTDIIFVISWWCIMLSCYVYIFIIVYVLCSHIIHACVHVLQQVLLF